MKVDQLEVLFTVVGLTTFMWGGAYRVPPPTLTGSIQTDLLIVDKV